MHERSSEKAWTIVDSRSGFLPYHNFGDYRKAPWLRRDDREAAPELAVTPESGSRHPRNILKVLTAARVPCAPVPRPAELIAEPHLEERAFFPAVPHPVRPIRVTVSPYHLDGELVHPATPSASWRPDE